MINSKELLFSVDENNKPIEPQPRALSHAKRIWHRTCHVYIIDVRSQQLLCQKRSPLKDNNPGLWEAFVGGHLLAGQTYHQAAAVEVGEEIGLRIKEEDLIFIKEEKNEKHPQYTGVFLYRWSGDVSSLKPEEDEVDRLEWFPVNKVVELTLIHPDAQWTHFGYSLDFLDSNYLL
jgi:8-oxo-dGTP pyrophosphatase MutT (NUDIX family)